MAKLLQLLRLSYKGQITYSVSGGVLADVGSMVIYGQHNIIQAVIGAALDTGSISSGEWKITV